MGPAALVCPAAARSALLTAQLSSATLTRARLGGASLLGGVLVG